MITIGQLRKLISVLPDSTRIIGGEHGRSGKFNGLEVKYKNKYGWIETGESFTDKCPPGRHALEDIVRKVEDEFHATLTKYESKFTRLEERHRQHMEA